MERAGTTVLLRNNKRQIICCLFINKTHYISLHYRINKKYYECYLSTLIVLQPKQILFNKNYRKTIAGKIYLVPSTINHCAGIGSDLCVVKLSA